VTDPVAIERPQAPTAPPAVAERVPDDLHRIVVVGGGAAGLELVTRLGDRLASAARCASR
jgi:NADH:ubiquinone reductase (H+-translocating)